MKSIPYLLQATAIAVLALGSITSASADDQILGPAVVNSAFSNADDSGYRININNLGITLAAGDYSLTDLTFFNTQPSWMGDTSSNGPLQAFIATESGATFTVIALGDSFATSGLTLNTVQSHAFGTNNTFTLTSETTIYLGFIGGEPGRFSPVGNDISYGSTTHIVPSSSFTPVVGETYDSTTIPNGYYNTNLTRTYGINVGITSVPEPTTVVMLIGGFGGLIMMQRARRRAA